MNIQPKVSHILLLGLVVAGSALPAGADTLYLQSGASVQGQIQSFDGQQYRVLLDDEVVLYRAEEVRAFAIERGQPSGLNPEVVNLILRKLDTLDYKLDSFSQQYQTTAEQMQQKIFDLNPISLVRVLSQSGTFDRQGNYVVRGRLLNESNDVVRYFRLRATLLDPNEEVLDSVDVQPTNRTIGPGATIPFQITFPNAPQNIGRVEIVPYLDTRSSEQDIGGYQQMNPVERYRQ